MTGECGAPLVVRFAAFGDVVLLAPLLELLARRFGRRVDVLGSGAWTRELLAADPAVGEIRLVKSRRAPYALNPGQWAAVRWLRARPAGPVYLCEPDAKAQWLLDRAGIPREHVVRAFDRPGDRPMHFSRWWLEVGARLPAAVEAIGDPVALTESLAQARAATDARPRLHVTEADRADCARWLEARGWGRSRLVLLQPGNKRTYKRGRLAGAGDVKYWLPGAWVAVARGVLEIEAATPTEVLLCGAPSEVGVLGDIGARAASDHVHEVSRELPVRRLLALLERAAGMISVDTGPAHAAAALDCPLVDLFAWQDQRVWCPPARGGEVIALGGAAGAASRVADITVEEVLGAWRRLGRRH